MRNTIKMSTGKPYPMGATLVEGGINIAVSMNCQRECGILLYAVNTRKEIRLAFTEEQRIGNIYCVLLEDVDPTAYEYNFYCDDKIVIDPYAKKIIGHEHWGKDSNIDGLHPVRAAFVWEAFSWEDDRQPQIPYEEAVFYCMHVRGFTKHTSSNVEARGTFRGIVDKIPYLKELGITTLEILPAYEFDEVESVEAHNLFYVAEHYRDETTPEKKRLNYWGFKKGYYFTPKAAYTKKGTSPIQELKYLIKELHKNKMELVMQFYFPKTVKPGFILEVLRYWVLEYHIDGIHLLGEQVPLTLIATDPLFSNTKLMYYDFPYDQIYMEGEVPAYRNLAAYDDKFMITARRFLKSDEDMLQSFLFHMKQNPAKGAVINYITNYSGFSLMDLVSFDKKHNAANGEDNRDGENYNHSWNCGCEGSTRKKAILSLRLKQIKNALVFLILAQGTPLLLSGDEFGDTKDGNNNAYCQDNAVSWLNWKLLEKNQEIFAFVKGLLRLRKEHPILRRPEECRIMDTMSCGYPDMSYHGEEVWRPIIDNYNRHIAIMYCGKYAKNEQGMEDNFFYIAYNMHWEEHVFSLPNLPKGNKWKQILSTESQHHKKSKTLISENNMEDAEAEAMSEAQIRVSPRSIVIMMSQLEDESAKNEGMETL